MTNSIGRTPTDRNYLSIREVLDALVDEFPDVTISKIRFLESRGLLHPERTPSGYRKFYDADIERLRWILRQQREHFLPLKVIKGRLDRQNGILTDPPEAPSLFDADFDAQEAAMALASVVSNIKGAAASTTSTRSTDLERHDSVASEHIDINVAVDETRLLASMVERGTMSVGTTAAVVGVLAVADPLGNDGKTRTHEAAPAGGERVEAEEVPNLDVVDEKPGTTDSPVGAVAIEPARATSEPASIAGHASGVVRGEAGTPTNEPRNTLEHRPPLIPTRAAAPEGSHRAPTEHRRPTPKLNDRPLPARVAGASSALPGSEATGSVPSDSVPSGSDAIPPSADGSLQAAEGDVEGDLSGVHFSLAELAAAASTTPELIAEIEEYGLIASKDIAGDRCYDGDALIVTKLAAGFRRFGIEARHLKAIKHSAERDAALFGQVVTPLLRQRNPEARERANRELKELGELGASLHEAFIRAELRTITGG